MNKQFILFVMLVFGLQTSLCRNPEDLTIKGVKTSVAAFVDFFPAGPLNSPVQVRSGDEFMQQFGKLKPKNEANDNVRQFFLNGGQEAWIVRVQGKNQVRAITGDSSSATGLYALSRVDIINFLCVPRLRSANEAVKLLRMAARYAEKRRAILITAVPKNLTSVSKITEWVSTFPGGFNIAMYYPGVKTPGQPAGMSMTGTVAGIIARIDTQYGIWRPPAGPDAWFANVTGFEREVSGKEGIDLTEAGVNPLRTTRGSLRLVWGTRIRTNDPEWKYLPVRRIALYIEESVERGTRWAASEPNNDSLWSQVRLSVTDFMQSLFEKRALLGSKPEQAYFVRCGSQTTTPEDVRKGIFTIQIGFAATRTGEFNIITIHQRAGTRLN